VRNCGSCFSELLISLGVFCCIELGIARQIWCYPFAQKEGIRSTGSTTPDGQCHFDDTVFPVFNEKQIESRSAQGCITPIVPAANAQPFEQAGTIGVMQPVQSLEVVLAVNTQTIGSRKPPLFYQTQIRAHPAPDS
jgi:hypothetical protein